MRRRHVLNPFEIDCVVDVAQLIDVGRRGSDIDRKAAAVSGRGIAEPELGEDEGIFLRQLFQRRKAPGLAAVAGAHVGLEDQHILVRFQVAQLGHPLGRFPIGDARIVQTGGHHQRRVGLCGHLIVGRVRTDQLEIGLAGNGVAPFWPFARRERQRFIQHGVEHIDKRHMGDDSAELFRCLVDDGAHQLAARRTATGRDHPRRRPAGRDQALGDINEIVERVGALGELAIKIPLIAQIIAAADLGDGKGHAAIQQAQPVGRKARHGRDAIGAIGIKMQLAGAIRLEALLVDNRDRHLHAVPRRHEEALAFILAGVITRWHFLHLSGDECAGLYVIIIDRSRRDHRGVVDAQQRGISLQIAADAGRISRFGEGQHGLAAVVLAQHDAIQPVAAALHAEIRRESGDAGDVIAIRTSDQCRPVARCLEAGGGDAEIHMIIVGADEQAIPPHIHFIAHPGLPALDQQRRRGGIGGRHQPHFARHMI